MFAVEVLVNGLGGLIAKMNERKQRFQARYDKLHDIIETAMLAGEIEKMVLPMTTLSIAKGGARATIITAREIIPDIYMKQPAPTPNLDAIKAAILGGAVVPG